jgi:hypothetical protein
MMMMMMMIMMLEVTRNTHTAASKNGNVFLFVVIASFMQII